MRHGTIYIRYVAINPSDPGLIFLFSGPVIVRNIQERRVHGFS